jgi:peptidoglycan/LPS O-acetylase OafA/YrhL
MDYRREIDGLRALAVIPVIFFHAGFQTFSGGFVGVDVFFVISGYLITSIILAEMQAGTFTLKNFYERRARRILPALLVVMFVCLPFAWLWLLPADMKSFLKSLVAVTFFVSNIFFYKQRGYFETDAELMPLLHTWSLAVEEQYYLFFPILLMLTWRFGKRYIVGLLILICSASLVYTQYKVGVNPNSAFFLLPSRIWELLIGAFVAFYFSSRTKLDFGNLVSQIASVIGLLLITYAIFSFDQQTPFPSLYALIPTIGTMLIILFATQQTMVGKLLGNRMFVGVGLVSYSAYLWHQPLFAFARHRSLEEPGTLLLSMLAVAAFVLAYFSWKYVETPFRNKQRFSRKKIFVYGAVLSALLVFLGVIGLLNKGYVFRAPLFQQLENIKKVNDSPCHTTLRRTAEQIAHGDICTLGTASVPNFAVIGDSHAGALFEGIKQYQAQVPFAFYAFSGGFCAPLLDYKLSLYQSKDCVETTLQAFKQIIKSPDIKYVVLAAQWANYTKGYREETGGVKNIAGLASDSSATSKMPSDNKAIFERTLLNTIQALKAAGKIIIVVKPVPDFKQNVIPAVSKQLMFATGTIRYPTRSLRDYNERNMEVLEIFGRLKDVSVVETKNLFCSEIECVSVGPEGNILFSDTNHVTEFGAKLIAKEIMAHIIK